MDESRRTILERLLNLKRGSSAEGSTRPRVFKRRSSVAAPRTPSAQTTVLIRRPGTDRPEPLPPARISDEIDKSDVLLWVDIRDPGPADLAMLKEEFNFNSLSLEDAGKQRQRPKVDDYSDYYFIVIYAPLIKSNRAVQMIEVDLFIGQNYVVSVHPGELPALEEAKRRWEKSFPDQRDRVGFLAHIVVDTIVDAFFPVVSDIDSRLHWLDDAMFHGNQVVNPEELLILKRGVFDLRRAIYPLREAFEEFPTPQHALFDLETHPYFQDVYDHIMRLLDAIDIQQEMVASALEAHLAFMSHRLNETMKTLTVVGICEALAAAVFGAWGMNVKGIPFTTMTVGGVEVGFWVACSVGLLLIGVTLVWLKWRGMW